ncbi:MAG TPA: ferritin-like domain-containing protein [Polyangiaceae bacterium]|nr:ferritin-like domain-containing protein [Polyangiaceae bacterium]
MCASPEPILPGTDTGIFYCDNYILHRAQARLCPTELPREAGAAWPAVALAPDAGAGDPPYTTSGDECSRDTDCGDELSRCETIRTNQPGVCSYLAYPRADYARLCLRGCRQDSDCGVSGVCVCSSPIGYCRQVSAVAGCHSDADCAGGARCLANAHSDIFEPPSFACALPGDECNSDVDCEGGQFCAIGETGRRCKPGAVCGRPFLVDAEPRVAAARRSCSWLVASEPGANSARHESPGSVSPELASELARHWTRIGLTEHASIAAFARFTLQLLGMGAPVELIEASGAAQADETRHTRVAFELASHYAAVPLGPASLSLSGSLLDADWAQILVTTIEEGCIGETCAAFEAAYAAELCADPVIARVLRSIADDEGRHAALAWRTVRWMLAERPSLEAFARAAFAEVARREAMSNEPLGAEPLASRASSAAESHGALEASTVAACRRRSLLEVVMPCARALLDLRLQTAAPAAWDTAVANS